MQRAAIVYCDNPDCELFEQRRVVAFPSLGKGVTMRGGLFCEACSYEGELRGEGFGEFSELVLKVGQ